MAHRPWPVFGLEGRSAEEVRDAVDLGYRRFDAGERYGRTTEQLAEAIRGGGLDRDGVEVLYRFEVRPNESREELKARLTEVADRFDGHLDAAVIGNLDASEEKVKEAWEVLGELKEDGTVAQVGVAGVAPRHANLLVDLNEQESVGVVDFAAEPGREQRGLGDGWRKNLLDALGGEEDLRYYEVVRALGELLGRAATQTTAPVLGQQAAPVPGQQAAQVPVQQALGQPQFVPGPGPSGAVPRSAPAGVRGMALRDDDTPLPDGVRELLVPLYEDPEWMRAEVRAFALGGAVDRETVSRWLMEERGFSREELEGVTVPDRVGLRGEFRDVKLADVLAGHLGADPRGQAVGNELGHALLQDAATWKEVRPALTTVAVAPGGMSVADVAALQGVNTLSVTRSRAGGGSGDGTAVTARPATPPSTTPRTR
ncbi:aldo/keto reductase [Streptomyces sp. CA-249302]|uniref:aldo/keto reductase n=1 Tax=Streptomyces sp. CA-249302 TaxID=3240058 RepID=UPI003D92FF7C